ncbi:hypothetical protein ACJZ2D_002504 [Fusarium nematophilum]
MPRDQIRAEGKLSTTLGAVTVLAYAEALSKSNRDNNFVTHAGGAAAWIEACGTECVRDELGLAMLNAAKGGIIVSSLVSGKRCFLAEPDWAELAFNQPSDCPIRRIADKLFHKLCLLTDILRETRVLDTSSSSQAAVHDLLNSACLLMSSVCEVRDSLRSLEGNRYSTVPSQREGSAVDTLYQFQDRLVSWVYTNCWALMIAANGVVVRIRRRLATDECGKQCPDGFLESLEFSEHFAPIGSMYMALPAVLAYSAVSEELKLYMLERLAVLNEGVVNWFSPLVLDYLAKWLLGDPVRVVETPPE